ncbi:DNA N-6-adenine-methyltransferase of bacteriophage [Brevibacillus reuszeri]|uniref:Adenine methyltransferase n=1 Tax=Brevibacillus reuszeri TaxID=54915 RepID=A0A0K9YL81_9BACL|nr:DNA N-6-adenine-methyltransferase [Brevibacillus reuszeri]KNB69503.1 adenine methyltransferase [Brevibacillus reuszeri]MED1856131.1 DNA N-6-adenine-methyltransferase [Brevibacillus reuszeri]GED71201.1 DNA N-6-adenine-methyltransferase of bacteriophage [Brevibacillus reuszeri]
MSKTNFNQGVFFNPETVTNVWETPQDLFDKLNEIFRFTTDVCALPDNAKCPQFFTPDQDGLKQEWTGTCWMNPPYGREISKWVQKAYEAAQQGATVVCLVPARTCSEWWHRYCMQGEIWFIRHRLKFGGSKINAPFPNAVVIFRAGTDGHSYKAIDRHGNFISA